MSTLKVTNIQATGETASRAVSGVAAAWAKYNMVTATVNDSVNLSSITDNGTGDFTNSWTSGFDSVNYANLANAGNGLPSTYINKQTFWTNTTSSVRLLTSFHDQSSDNGEGTPYDYSLLSLIAHGDLA